MAEEEGDRIGKGSAADLLSAWRAAERDRAAAVETASVAELAVAAAWRAADAARETADAAKLSLEAAQRAERAARETAEAADIFRAAATVDHAAADSAVARATEREADAKQAFHDAQLKGFPKAEE